MLRYDITLNSRQINSDCAAKTLPQETFRFTFAQNTVSGFIWDYQKKTNLYKPKVTLNIFI